MPVGSVTIGDANNLSATSKVVNPLFFSFTILKPCNGHNMTCMPGTYVVDSAATPTARLAWPLHTAVAAQVPTVSFRPDRQTTEIRCADDEAGH